MSGKKDTLLVESGEHLVVRATWSLQDALLETDETLFDWLSILVLSLLRTLLDRLLEENYMFPRVVFAEAYSEGLTGQTRKCKLYECESTRALSTRSGTPETIIL